MVRDPIFCLLHVPGPGLLIKIKNYVMNLYIISNKRAT